MQSSSQTPAVSSGTTIGPVMLNAASIRSRSLIGSLAGPPSTTRLGSLVSGAPVSVRRRPGTSVEWSSRRRPRSPVTRIEPSTTTPFSVSAACRSGSPAMAGGWTWTRNAVPVVAVWRIGRRPSAASMASQPSLRSDHRARKRVRPVVEDRDHRVGTRRNARGGGRCPVDQRVGERRELVGRDGSRRERPAFAHPEAALERLEIGADQPGPAFVGAAAKVRAEPVVEPDVDRRRRVGPAVADRQPPGLDVDRDQAACRLRRPATDRAAGRRSAAGRAGLRVHSGRRRARPGRRCGTRRDWRAGWETGDSAEPARRARRGR